MPDVIHSDERWFGPPGLSVFRNKATRPTPGPLSAANEDLRRRHVRRAMRIGLWAWPPFFILDIWMCFVAFPGTSLGPFIACRVIVEALIAAVYFASLNRRFSLRAIQVGHDIAFVVAGLAIPVMAVPLGGIESVYMHGITVVTLVRAALIPQPWNRSWPVFAALAISFPLVMTVVALWSPSLRVAWTDSESLVVFASNYVFVVSSAFVGMVTGHLVWSAQEQVYRARRIGRYRLMAPLGKGGMGEVWLAWDLSLQRNVALKLLRTMSDTGPEVIARFEREALATSRLQSPHVVQIYDYGASDDGMYYIAMEYLQGRDLASEVRESGPLPTSEAVDVAIQACHALEAAHEAGVIHRDVKPENLFVVADDSAGRMIKLLDFGIVRFRDTRTANLTTAGTLFGTPYYIAPEVWQGAPADERSDVYSLGVTFYYVLTGRVPFDDADGTAKGPPPPVFERPTPAERILENLLRQCLDPDPQRRTASAREFRMALESSRTAGTN